VSSPTEDLKQDHRVIERVCRVLATAASRLEAGGQVSPEVFELALRFIREFADAYHHGKEEALLFPALEARGVPREGGPTGVMLIEHDQGRGFVRGMAEALEQWRAGRDAARAELARHARGYSQLLGEHIPKEDDILYPMADGVLELGEQRELMEKFQAVDGERLGEAGRQPYLELVERLETELGQG